MSYLTPVSLVVDDSLFIFDVPDVLFGVDECMSTTEQLDFSITPYNVQCKSHYYCYDYFTFYKMMSKFGL